MHSKLLTFAPLRSPQRAQPQPPDSIDRNVQSRTLRARATTQPPSGLGGGGSAANRSTMRGILRADLWLRVLETEIAVSLHPGPSDDQVERFGNCHGCHESHDPRSRSRASARPGSRIAVANGTSCRRAQIARSWLSDAQIRRRFSSASKARFSISACGAHLSSEDVKGYRAAKH